MVPQSDPRTFSYNLAGNLLIPLVCMYLYFPYVYIVNYEIMLGEN
jgi:hypothetical protein